MKPSVNATVYLMVVNDEVEQTIRTLATLQLASQQQGSAVRHLASTQFGRIDEVTEFELRQGRGTTDFNLND